MTEQLLLAVGVVFVRLLCGLCAQRRDTPSCLDPDHAVAWLDLVSHVAFPEGIGILASCTNVQRP